MLTLMGHSGSHPLPTPSWCLSCFVFKRLLDFLKQCYVLYTASKRKIDFFGGCETGAPRNSEVGCVYQLGHLAAALFMALVEGKFQHLENGGLIVPCTLWHKKLLQKTFLKKKCY